MNISKALNKMTVLLHKPDDLSGIGGRSKERERRIALTSFMALFSKFLSMTIPLITIKITLDYLGTEIYGLWASVTSFFTLFVFADLGLGNGLQTRLSQASGVDDKILSQKLISSTYAILTFITILLLTIAILSFSFIDWSKLLNASSSTSKSLLNGVVLLLVLAHIFSIPLTIVQRTQLALQEGYNFYFWSSIGSILSLILIFIIAKFDLGQLTLIGSSAFVTVVVSGVNMYVYYGIIRKDLKPSIKYVDKALIVPMFKTGILFCVLMVLNTIGLSMDTFIVARTCSLSEAASFFVIYKVSMIESGIVGLIALPLWGANGEALARGDYEWVKRNTMRVSRLLIVITAFIALGILLSAKFVFRLWLGEDFVFSYGALIWLCILPIVTSFVSPYFMVLNAKGIIKEQILLYMIFTPISFMLKYFMSLKFGVSVIPLISILCYLIILVPGTIYFARKTFIFNRVIKN